MVRLKLGFTCRLAVSSNKVKIYPCLCEDQIEDSLLQHGGTYRIHTSARRLLNLYNFQHSLLGQSLSKLTCTHKRVIWPWQVKGLMLVQAPNAKWAVLRQTNHLKGYLTHHNTPKKVQVPLLAEHHCSTALLARSIGVPFNGQLHFKMNSTTLHHCTLPILQ